MIVRVSVVLKRTVGFGNLSGSHPQSQSDIIIFYRQRMVFMSLVIDLIGQLNCHVIGCETRKS